MQTTPQNEKGRRAGNTTTPMQTGVDATAAASQEQPPIVEIEEQSVGDEQIAVLARKLHAALGVRRDFTSWFKAQVKRGGFAEGIDFVLLTQKGEQTGSGGHNRSDYAMTLDTAKHVALLSSSSKGREYRARLIRAERELRRIKAGAHLSAAEQLWRLKAERDLLERRGSDAGRTLGSLRRCRQENDAAAAPLLEIVQPQLFDQFGSPL